MVIVDLVSVSARPDRHYFLTSNTPNPVLYGLSLHTTLMTSRLSAKYRSQSSWRWWWLNTTFTKKINKYCPGLIWIIYLQNGRSLFSCRESFPAETLHFLPSCLFHCWLLAGDVSCPSEHSRPSPQISLRTNSWECAAVRETSPDLLFQPHVLPSWYVWW